MAILFPNFEGAEASNKSYRYPTRTPGRSDLPFLFRLPSLFKTPASLIPAAVRKKKNHRIGTYAVTKIQFRGQRLFPQFSLHPAEKTAGCVLKTLF